MNKLTLLSITSLSCFLIFLSGCSSLDNNQQAEIVTHQAQTERNKKLATLTNWKINGKMAVITPDERHGLTLNWHYQGDKKKQVLNLTTILGIQVFNLESVNGMHTVDVNGERYQSSDLNKILASLTSFTLPTQAMTLWLKGLPYLGTDVISYNAITDLPESLISYYDEKKWQVKYSSYRQIEQYQLATKFTIKQGDFSIKINVHQWDVSINDL
ncbi:MAG: outer membrane lipoprotein LolB [Colwellia sp.]|nr:outer membrane lipoprotein LolB [Colwellia sp.]